MASHVTRTVKALTDAGYNPDFIDAELLAMKGKVNGNALAFGDVRYHVVVLPSVERIPPTTMKTLEAFAQAGGILVATKRFPDLAPGYKATEQETASVRDMAQQLFAGSNAPGTIVADESQLGDVLTKRLPPVAAMSPASPEIGVVHRSTDAGEVFFNDLLSPGKSIAPTHQRDYGRSDERLTTVSCLTLAMAYLRFD